MPDITAKLRKIIWRSTEDDFTIASFLPEEIGPEFIATGDLFRPSEGIVYSMVGKWDDHPKYGKQFKINSYCVQEPCDADSIAIYLEKHIKGLGPVLSEQLIDQYGKHTIRLLKNSPERISNENKNISYKLLVSVSEQLQEGDKRQDILIKLEGMFGKVKGLPKKLATDALNIYGLTAYETIKNNPYVLLELNRIGFILADKVAMSCGIKRDDPERIRQGILYVIRQAMNESGDVWMEPIMVYDNLESLISKSSAETILVRNTIINLIKDKILIKYNGYVTLTKFADDEDLIAKCVGRFL